MNIAGLSGYAALVSELAARGPVPEGVNGVMTLAAELLVSARLSQAAKVPATTASGGAAPYLEKKAGAGGVVTGNDNQPVPPRQVRAKKH